MQRLFDSPSWVANLGVSQHNDRGQIRDFHEMKRFSGKRQSKSHHRQLINSAALRNCCSSIKKSKLVLSTSTSIAGSPGVWWVTLETKHPTDAGNTFAPIRGPRGPASVQQTSVSHPLCEPIACRSEADYPRVLLGMSTYSVIIPHSFDNIYIQSGEGHCRPSRIVED